MSCRSLNTGTWLRALARTSVPIPVRRQEKSPIPAQWSMRPCHSGMPLLVPFPLRWACLHRSDLQIAKESDMALTFSFGRLC